MESYVHKDANVSALLMSQDTQAEALDLVLKEMVADKLVSFNASYVNLTNVWSIDFRYRTGTTTLSLNADQYLVRLHDDTLTVVDKDVFDASYDPVIPHYDPSYTDEAHLSE